MSRARRDTALLVRAEGAFMIAQRFQSTVAVVTGGNSLLPSDGIGSRRCRSDEAQLTIVAGETHSGTMVSLRWGMCLSTPRFQQSCDAWQN